MAKKGTTTATGMAYKAKSTAGVRHGQYTKNLGPNATPRQVGGGNLVQPIKGRDRGGL